MGICELSVEEMRQIEIKLDDYDSQHLPEAINEMFKIGYTNEHNEVIGGLFATSTAFNIVYVSMVFVDEAYRQQGIGKQLMHELEKQARQKGAKWIRLDTFDFQGKAFYEALGYEKVGGYTSDNPPFSEYFFLKRL